MKYHRSCFVGLVLLFAAITFASGCADEPPVQPAPAAAAPEKPSPEKTPAAKEPEAEKPPEKAVRLRATVEMKPDGTLLLDSKEFQPKEFVKEMRLRAKDAPIVSTEEGFLSLLEVLIKAKKGDRYGRVSGMLGAIASTGVSRIYFSHPDVNEGKEIKFFLPCDAARTRKLTLQEVRIRLHWVDSSNPDKKLYAEDDPAGTKGMLALKVSGSPMFEENPADWQSIEDKLEKAVKAFRPTEHYKKLPVIIDPMAKVPFEDVLKCILTCRKYDTGDLSLAPPEDHFRRR